MKWVDESDEERAVWGRDWNNNHQPCQAPTSRKKVFPDSLQTKEQGMRKRENGDTDDAETSDKKNKKS